MLITAFLNGNIKFRLDNLTLGLLTGFLFFGLLSALFSFNQPIAFSTTLKVFLYAFSSFIIFLFIKNSPINIFLNYKAINVICWVGLMVSLIMITDFFNLTNFSDLFGYGGGIRQGGILGNPDHASATFSIILPLFLYCLMENQVNKNLTKVFSYMIFSFIVISANLLTGSRMGFLMLAATGIIFSFVEKKYLFKFSTRRLFLFIAVMIIGVGAVYLVRNNDKIIELVTSLEVRAKSIIFFVILHEDVIGRSMDSRAELLSFGWKMFLAHPLFGSGLSASYPLLEQVLMSPNAYHNTFMDILVGTGLFGFSFFIGMLFVIGKNLYKLWRISGDRKYFYLLLSFLNVCMEMFFLSSSSNRFLWTVFIPLSLYADSCKTKKLAVLLKTKIKDNPDIQAEAIKNF
ncbi:MAG: O-antigen ligase family protein [bacterium]|nr:O-antigen ligase family protein [bacterium]